MKKIFYRFRLNLGFSRLRKEIKKRTRNQNHSVSIRDANRIGILMTIKDEKQVAEAELFAKTLQTGNKEVKLLGFIFDKTLKIKSSSNMELLYAEDIDWSYVPNKEKIKNFINNEFDILINLCTDLCFPLVYVAGLSNSVFKVAAYNPKQAPFFDLMIETKSKSITSFSKELRYYLDKIK
jgi:hypothetical protein